MPDDMPTKNARMTFGILASPNSVGIDECRRIWQWADRGGIEHLALSDHLAATPSTGSPDVFEAIALMAAVACETRHVRIGNWVLAFTFRNPGLLAKSLATIDHLSGGRVEPGLGVAYVEGEHRMFGLPFDRMGVRQDRFEEYIQCLRLLLEEQEATFHGEHYSLDRARCDPKPIQKRVPLWVGGLGEKRTLPTAAKYADGWNGGLLTPEAYIQKSRLLDQLCESNGRDPKTLRRSVNLWFLMGADERSAAAKRPILDQLATVTEGRLGALLGTPDEVIDTVGRYLDLGLDRLIITILRPYDWEALDAYAELVLPAFGVKRPDPA